MDADGLKNLQAPLKARYNDDPATALITLSAEGRLDGDGLACSVETGKALVEAGLHPATGGDGTQACSGDMLLQALVACAGVTLNAVATAIGVDVRAGTVKAEGDQDFRGTLGVSKEAPVGFRDIRLHFDLETDADGLKNLQAPLKARYNDDPATALITLRAEGRLDGDGLACSVETGKALV